MANVLEIVGGLVKRIIPNLTSAGAADANKTVQLGADGKLHSSLLPAAALLGNEDYAIVASENLSAGDLINVFDNAGTANVRKADATDGTKPPMGFVAGAVIAGATGDVRIGNGVITGLAGLTVGGRYYLDTATPGGIALTAPSVTGAVVYAVGRATSATEFNYIDDTTPVLLG